jgi:hypothetical protein
VFGAKLSSRAPSANARACERPIEVFAVKRLSLLLPLVASAIACGDDAAPATAADASSDPSVDVAPDLDVGDGSADSDGADDVVSDPDDAAIDTDASDAGSDGSGLDAAVDVEGSDARADVDAGDVAADTEEDGWVDDQSGPYPEATAWGTTRGPGASEVTFTEDELFVNCAYLDGGIKDVFDHHNLLLMFDGYLMMPWAPEWGQGGLTFWEFDDPCAPVEVGTGWDRRMRETHSVGFADVHGRWYAVVNSLERFDRCGIMIWDVTDVTAPTVVTTLNLPGCAYPDSYTRIGLSVFWQYPYIYVAGSDNGVWIVDASDPTAPVLVSTYAFDPVLRAGQVQAVGDLLFVQGAESTRTVILDISDPTDPQPIPGGDFTQFDSEGVAREAYFSNVAGGYIYFAVKSGGGLMLYDVRDPSAPTWAGEYRSGATAGYVAPFENYAFVGDSNYATVYDLTDLAAITPVGQFNLEGDLDTLTPIGNVALVSCDDGDVDDQGTAVAPWRAEPDTTAPTVTWARPDNLASDVFTTIRPAVTFSEMVEPRSAWIGSVRLYKADSDPNETRVPGHVGAQELIVTFSPSEPLEPNTTYVFEITSGGVVDYSGNAVDATFTMTFTTGDL